jgi:hypothetical protein
MISILFGKPPRRRAYRERHMTRIPASSARRRAGS